MSRDGRRPNNHSPDCTPLSARQTAPPLPKSLFAHQIPVSRLLQQNTSFNQCVTNCYQSIFPFSENTFAVFLVEHKMVDLGTEETHSLDARKSLRIKSIASHL